MARKWVNGEEVQIDYQTSDGNKFANENDARKHQDLIDECSQNFPSYLENAKKGDSASFYNVGLCYYHGWGVGKNSTEAFFWLSKAEVNGSKNANFLISTYIQVGKGGKSKWKNPEGGGYEGYFFNGIFHGVGKLTYPNGDVYEGDWFDGKRNGKGKMTFANGIIYEGDFVEGNYNGKGKMTYADGRVEEGEWEDGKFVGSSIPPNFTGKGKYQYYDDMAFYTDGVYEGDWKNGKPHGKGKYTMEEGGIYEGDFANGVPHGKGKMIWGDTGEVQDGEWKDGEFIEK